MDLLRSLGIWLCEGIYTAIPKLYSIFYNLANARFFAEDDSIIEQLSSNIYVLVSVVMLFIFSASFLAAIVNPDAFADKKKGVGAVFKRAFIGIALIVLIPFAFNEAYEIQTHIMDNNLVEKILVGIDFDSNGDAKSGGNGGQVIAGSLIGSVLYPVDDNVSVNVDIATPYREMVRTNIEAIDRVADYINVAPADGTSTERYAFHFDGIIALIAGFGACYLLLIFAMDMAVRMFKHTIFELTAPISVVAYMAAGDDQLKKWGTEVGKTLIDVYIRIGAMAFYILLISHLNEFLSKDPFATADWKFLLQVLLIIGMLIFIKKFPDTLNAAFGTNWKPQGGIGGRLEQMAIVGNTAKKAWDTVTGALGRVAAVGAVAGAGVATFGVGGAAVAGIGYGGASHWWRKGFNGGTAGKDTAVGKTLRKTGAWLTGGRAAVDKINESDTDYQNKQYQQQSQHTQAVKDKITKNAQNSANKVVSNLYVPDPTNPNKLVLSGTTAQHIVSNGTADSDYDKILKSSHLNTFEQNVIKDYNKARDDKNMAESRQNYYTQVSHDISNAIAASTSQADKKALMDLQVDLDNGGMTSSAIWNTLNSISSLKDPNGQRGLSSTANRILNSASKLVKSGTTTESKADIDKDVVKATGAETRAEKAYNDAVAKASPQKQAEMKAYNTIGEDIGKWKIL